MGSVVVVAVVVVSIVVVVLELRLRNGIQRKLKELLVLGKRPGVPGRRGDSPRKKLLPGS